MGYAMRIASIESLETRRFLTADPGATLLQDGTLLVIGSSGHDMITIDGVSSNRILVNDNQPVVVQGHLLPNDLFKLDFDPAAVTRVEVHLGDSSDSVRYNVAVPAEMWGDDGSDAIISDSASPITLHGGDGKDVLVGGSGDDALFGEASTDQLFGHGGNDLLSGGGGGDHLHGYEGRDRLYGGPGSDLINGEEGSDRIYGHEGDDTLIGGQGNDSLFGGAGADRMTGGSNNDFFSADDSEADTVFGDGGDDFATLDGLDIVNSVTPVV